MDKTQVLMLTPPQYTETNTNMLKRSSIYLVLNTKVTCAMLSIPRQSSADTRNCNRTVYTAIPRHSYIAIYYSHRLDFSDVALDHSAFLHLNSFKRLIAITLPFTLRYHHHRRFNSTLNTILSHSFEVVCAMRDNMYARHN